MTDWYGSCHQRAYIFICVYIHAHTNKYANSLFLVTLVSLFNHKFLNNQIIIQGLGNYYKIILFFRLAAIGSLPIM